MTTNEILEVVDLYETKLTLLLSRDGAMTPDGRHDMATVLRMIPQMRESLRQSDALIRRYVIRAEEAADEHMVRGLTLREQVFKSLGFVQGVLWSRGIYTLEEVQTHAPIQ